MSGLYKNEKEKNLHSSAISSIASQYKLDENKVRAIYETELVRLLENVRVNTFLPVLCVKHVKMLLAGQGMPEELYH